MSPVQSPQAINAVASKIDHTLLKNIAVAKDIERLCAEALEYHCASVCVYSSWVSKTFAQLRGTPVKVCTVVGFPHGCTDTHSKVTEAVNAIRDGAQEIDMVLHVGRLLQGDEPYVLSDIQALAIACHDNEATLKVIIETGLLNDSQKRLSCQLVEEAGADFIKSCTGFVSHSKATLEDTKLFKECLGDRLGIKMSAGIDSLQFALALIDAGATRLGTSQTAKILGLNTENNSNY